MLKAGTAARRQSLRPNAPQAPDQITDQITVLLRGIDERLQADAPQWIGHVKILVGDADQSTYGSLTMANDTPRWQGGLTHDLANAELTIYAAIYDVADDQVAAAVDGALRAWHVTDHAASTNNSQSLTPDT